MVQECKASIMCYQGIPDLACLMLIKICKMIVLCIETFKDVDATGAPWTRFFEGNQGGAMLEPQCSALSISTYGVVVKTIFTKPHDTHICKMFLHGFFE